MLQDGITKSSEVWLRTNHRALALGLAAAALIVIGGISGLYVARLMPQGEPWLSLASGTAVLISGYFMLAIAFQLTLPRLAYEDGFLLVYLKSAAPERVPIEIVELFFLGQGSSF